MKVSTREQSILAEHIMVADTFIARGLGLMGRKQVPGDGLLLRPCGSIHTCFMRIPIDVIFLSAEGRVLACQAHLVPWRFAPAPRKTAAVLECRAGFIQTHTIQPGDTLRFT